MPNSGDFSPAKRLNLASQISAGGTGTGVGDAGSLPRVFDMGFRRRCRHFAGGSELEKNIAGRSASTIEFCQRIRRHHSFLPANLTALTGAFHDYRKLSAAIYGCCSCDRVDTTVVFAAEYEGRRLQSNSSSVADTSRMRHCGAALILTLKGLFFFLSQLQGGLRYLSRFSR